MIAEKQKGGKMQDVEVIEAEVAESSSTAIERYERPGLRYTPDQMAQAIRELDEYKTRVMRQGVDYGVISGLDKPTLLKPGAERLMQAFRMGSVTEMVRCIEDWEKGLFFYVYRVGVGPIGPDGDVHPIAWCEGSANSRESKYRWRYVYPEKATPEEKAKGTLVHRKSARGGSYQVYRLENDEPFELVNTLQKMAQKRAFVGAVLLATGTSEFFTQDVEDLAHVAEAAEDKVASEVDVPGDMVLSFGQHRGKTLAQLWAEGEDGQSYVRWLAANAKNQQVRNAAARFLEKAEVGEGPVPERPTDAATGAQIARLRELAKQLKAEDITERYLAATIEKHGYAPTDWVAQQIARMEQGLAAESAKAEQLLEDEEVPF